MSQISQKSISGITSITTPAGVDNQFTLHTNNTSEALKLDHAGNIHIHNHVNTTGISSASNFKTGSSNLHSTGLNVQDLDVDGHTNLDNVSIAGVTTHDASLKLNTSKRLEFGTGSNSYMYYESSGSTFYETTGGYFIQRYKVPGGGHEHMFEARPNSSVLLFFNGSEKLKTTTKGIQVGTGVTIETNGQATYTGIVTATAFHGDGSDLTNLPAGLGTALSATASSPLNKMYYTNQVLGVPSSVTVDVPESASKAYTQYADIKVESSADLIIAEGDDLIPDVLGLADFGTFGGGASAGRIRVNSISNAANDGSPTVQKGLVVTGVCTATSFSGDGSALTGLSGLSVANQSDNRLITCTGTTDSLNGEQYLTYTSQSSLNLTDGNGTSNLGGNYLLLKRSTGNSNYINAPLANAELLLSADESIIFKTVHTADFNSTERLRITSGGHISQGGGAEPSSSNGSVAKKFGIKSNANNVIIGETESSGAGSGLHIESRQTGRSGGARIAQIGMKNDAGGNGQISFFTSPSGADVVERMTISSAGYVTTPYTVSFMARGMTGSTYDSGTMTGLSSGHNVGNHYNSSTGVFTAPVAGRYLTGCGVLVQSGSGRLEGNISLNNSTQICNFNGTGTTYDGATATAIVQMSANDTLRIKRQSGNAYDSGHGNHYFFAHLLG